MTQRRQPGPILGFLGSVQLAMILLIVGALAMAVGTVLESRSGRDFAQSAVYASLWFDLYLLLIAVNLVAAVVNRWPIQRHQWGFVLTHFSIVVLLVGAWVSRTYGYEGLLVVEEGETFGRLYMNDSELELRLPDGATELSQVARYEDPTGRVLASGPGRPEVRVSDFAYEARVREHLQAVGAGGEPGLSFRLQGEGGGVDSWLLAHHPRYGARELGGLRVSIEHAHDAPELARELEARPAGGAALVLARAGDAAPVRIELPGALGQPVALGDGVEAVVTSYFQRALVAEDGLREAPQGPVNPAAKVELRRGEHVETHTVFALYPDFVTSQGVEGEPLAASLRLEAQGGDGRPRLRVVTGPDGSFHLQLDGPMGRQAAVALTEGAEVPLPELGLAFRAERLLPRAKVGGELVHMRPGTSGAGTCVALELRAGDERDRVVLPRGTSAAAFVGGERYELAFRPRERELPFAVELRDFRLELHPGSSRPASYESHVRVLAQGGAAAPVDAVISMNAPLDHEGFRIFQTGYRESRGGGPQTSTMTVSYDPGVKIVYPSFFLLILGVGWYLVGDMRRRRARKAEILQMAAAERERAASPESAMSRTTLVSACFAALAWLGAGELSPVHAQEGETAAPMPVERTAGWAVQAGGRVKPLETLARESALAITGRMEHEGLAPLELFWGLTLDSAGFRARELVRVDGKELKALAGLPVDQRRFSFDALAHDRELEEIVDRALRREEGGELLSEVEREALAMFRRMDLVASLTRGGGLQMIPVDEDPAARWATPAELPPDAPALEGMRAAYTALGEAWRAQDAAGFGAAAEQLEQAVAAFAGPERAPAATLERELFYNRFNAFGKAWGFYLVGLLVTVLFGLARKRAGYWLGLALLVVGLVCHSIGIGLRWSIAGRAPVSDMYESLVFMGWGAVAIGLVLEGFYRRGYFATGAGLMGFVILAFSENLPIESGINPLAPVLANTSWLSIHVMTIMLSYSAFALAMALGHVTLFMQLFRPGRTEALRSVSTLLYKTLQVGVLFLAAGIAFGAIWANESWGRYWGWDPKETWSLITFFAYLALIHARFAGWIQNFGLSLSAIACFLTVLMTYYGVNFILGAGLHSYGFASGGMLWVGLYVALELGVMIAATLRYRGAEHQRLALAGTRA